MYHWRLVQEGLYVYSLSPEGERGLSAHSTGPGLGQGKGAQKATPRPIHRQAPCTHPTASTHRDGPAAALDPSLWHPGGAVFCVSN